MFREPGRREQTRPTPDARRPTDLDFSVSILGLIVTECVFVWSKRRARAGRRVRVCRLFVRIGRYKVLILIGVNKIGEDLYI